MREPLSWEETDRLVNACKGFREKLIVWVLLDTGMRVHELCGLRRQDVHWQENHMVVWGKGGPFGKQGKRRIVPLTERAKRLLEMQFMTSDHMG